MVLKKLNAAASPISHHCYIVFMPVCFPKVLILDTATHGTSLVMNPLLVVIKSMPFNKRWEKKVMYA